MRYTTAATLILLLGAFGTLTGGCLNSNLNGSTSENGASGASSNATGTNGLSSAGSVSGASTNAGSISGGSTGLPGSSTGSTSGSTGFPQTSSGTSGGTGSSTGTSSSSGTTTGALGCVPGQGPCTSPSDCCGPVTSCNDNVCCGIVDGPCNSNSDCCGGNACGPDNTCQITLGQGYGGADADCSTGQCSSAYSQCVCAADGTACTSPKNCCSGVCGTDGNCAANTTLGGSCAGSGGCGPEENCQGSSCCIPTESTETCNDDGDCCEKACDFSLSFTGFGVCCGKLHQSCASDLDCCVFFACSDGVCKLHTGGLGYGLFCHNGTECVSGFCSGSENGGCASGDCSCATCGSDNDCPPSSTCTNGACSAPDAG